MRGLYGNILSSANGYQPFNSDSSLETKTLVNPYHKMAFKDDNNTSQFLAPPTKE
ncbi:hypothetical protein NIES4072_04180 [Nostoc commune NIES-4072]|uniref:Uncharacterized protein n=1 Tax=Nostoc commune NIES-4072 TaxID=2005467 RepID=A0A2R5FE93_NOSCO|nr:hypothetical protein NIES4070_22640 [Nostoc commune HK-02]GBG16772.1 hypothetical protein NIES4072_04180 [Nostoc commune NIES-4072]